MLCSEKLYDLLPIDEKKNYNYLHRVYAHGKLEHILKTDILYGDIFSNLTLTAMDNYGSDNRKIYRTKCIDNQGHNHDVICFSWLYNINKDVFVHGLVVTADEDVDILKDVIDKYYGRTSLL